MPGLRPARAGTWFLNTNLLPPRRPSIRRRAAIKHSNPISTSFSRPSTGPLTPPARSPRFPPQQAMLLLRKLHLLPFPTRATTVLPFCYQCHLPIAGFAAASANPAPFAVEEYLVTSCYLTPARAIKASKILSHLKNPSKPDAVLSFLSGLGLSNTDIAAVVASDPHVLCASVDKTLTPRLAEFRDFGLTPSQIARLLVLGPHTFRRPTTVSRLQYYSLLFGSVENFFRVIKNNSYLLSCDLEKAVKPNAAFLRECGLDACGIAKLCHCVPRLITTNPEIVRTMVANAEEIGRRRGTPMFRHTLRAVAFVSKEKIAAKAEFLKRTFKWSDAEARVAIQKLPLVLKYSQDRLRRMSEFLIFEVGMVPEDIAYKPWLLGYSLEGRLMPRHHAMKFLKANGLIDRALSYYAAVVTREEVFVEKYIRPHKEAAPRLAEDYAAACRGEAPTGSILQ